MVRHGDLTAGQRLDDRPPGEAPVKVCPECQAEVPISVPACPLCGFMFPTVAEEKAEKDHSDLIRRAKLIEIDLLSKSPFSWEPIFDDVMVATGFSAQAVVANTGEVWIAVGLVKPHGSNLVQTTALRLGLRHQALAAADDFLRTHEASNSAHKTAAWMTLPPTDKQVELLSARRISVTGMSRYAASARLTWEFNQSRIRYAARQALGA